MVMFEEDRSLLPRAYVPHGVDREEAFSIASAWCAAQVDQDATRVGILVPSPRVVDDLASLSQAQARGAAVAAWRHSSANRRVTGAQVAYFPDLEHLLSLEDRHTTALVLVGATTEHAPWLTAYSPGLLTGDPLELPALRLDPVVMCAMDTFTSSINSSTGLTDPRDESRVVDGLTKLAQAGHRYTRADLIAQALRCNWTGNAAMQLGVVAAELLAGKRKRTRETYRDDVVELWRADAETTP